MTTKMPSPVLPEITLPSPGFAPPMTKPVVFVRLMPLTLDTGEFPVIDVPMRFPWMTFAPPPVDWMPVVLPLMRFLAPAAAPPIRFPFTPDVRTTPTPFGTAIVPVGSVPRKQASTTLSFDSIWMPEEKSLTQTPRIVFPPVPVIRSPAPVKLEISIRGVPA